MCRYVVHASPGDIPNDLAAIQEDLTHSDGVENNFVALPAPLPQESSVETVIADDQLVESSTYNHLTYPLMAPNHVNFHFFRPRDGGTLRRRDTSLQSTSRKLIGNSNPSRMASVHSRWSIVQQQYLLCSCWVRRSSTLHFPFPHLRMLIVCY